MILKREYEDGSVYYEPDSSEMENLEYVFKLCDDYLNGHYYPYRFFNRMCCGQIKPPFNKEQFLDNEDIVPTLEGYKLDLEKFWLVMLFIYDWTESQFAKCLDVKSHSHGALLRELLDKLGDQTSDVIIQIRKGRKNLDVHPMIKNDMLDALRAKLKELQQKGLDDVYSYRFGDFTDNFPVMTYKMYFATERLQELYAALDRFELIGKPKRRKGSIVSYNKMLLFSRIIYLFRYTDNIAFLDSDESLKGIMKDYKGKIPQTLSAIYD